MLQKTEDWQKLEQKPQIPIQDCYELINIAISTTKIKKLEIETASETKQIRPQIHTIIAGQIGSGKSHVLYQICDNFGITPYASITKPQMLGTIDRETKEAILPITWHCRNGILPIDDLSFTKDNQETNKIMLQMLENPQIKRPISYKLQKPIKKTDKDLSIKIGLTGIEMKTRFMLLATTMKHLWKKQKNLDYEALRTRCLVIPFFPTWEESMNIALGHLQYKFSRRDLDETKTIASKTWEKCVKMAHSPSQLMPYEMLRTSYDLARIYAVVGWNENILSTIIKLRSSKCYY